MILASSPTVKSFKTIEFEEFCIVTVLPTPASHQFSPYVIVVLFEYAFIDPISWVPL